MLIYIKIIKIIFFKKFIIYDNFMLFNVKIKKKKMFFIGQTHGQLKTIVRNLTKIKKQNEKKTNFITDRQTDRRTTSSSEPHKIDKKKF